MAEGSFNTITTAYELFEGAELWEEIEGQWRATGTGLIYRKKDGQLYYAWSSLTFRDYRKPGDILVNEVVKEILVPTEAYCPPFKSSYTEASNLFDDVHVKMPSLKSYNWLGSNEDKSNICKTVLRELDVCERIKDRAHPNLARYLGCQVKGCRVSGLCFTKYGQTLQQVFNPACHNKRAVNTPGWSAERIAQCLDPIESALQHLHSMGLAHNDVNPSNIMFDSENKPVLIDFGSCCQIGLSLEGIGRTYEWHDEAVNTSQPSNDLDAVQEMHEWLSQKDTKTFRFQE